MIQTADNDFTANLQNYIANPKNRNKPIPVCDTPNVLLAVGAKQLPVVMNPNDIDKCLAVRAANRNKNSHELTVDELSALPELLSVPVFIFKDPKTGYLSVVSDVFDHEGRPFVIGVELDATLHNHIVNRIATIHGRDRAYGEFTARNGKIVLGYIPRSISEGNLLAINMEKAPDFLHSTGLQLPEGEGIMSFDNSIAHSMASVKTIFKEEKAMEPKAYPAVYMDSANYAMENGDELALYKESKRLNNACATDIDKAIRENTVSGEMAGTQYVDTQKAFETVAEIYGAERVCCVAAMYANHRQGDRRISEKNKQWASGIESPHRAVGDHQGEMYTHPHILDGFLDRVRQAYETVRELDGYSPARTYELMNSELAWKLSQSAAPEYVVAIGGKYKLNASEATQYVVMALNDTEALLRREIDLSVNHADSDPTPYIVATLPEIDKDGYISWQSGYYASTFESAASRYMNDARSATPETATEIQNTREEKTMEQSISARVTPIENETKLKGLATVSIGGQISIHGIRVVDGKDGLFVAMPGERDGEGNTHEFVLPASKEAHAVIKDVVLKAYESALQDQNEAQMERNPQPVDIKVGGIRHSTNEGSNIKGDCQVAVNDTLVIKGVRVVVTKEGDLSVVMPSKQTQDGDYTSIVVPQSKEFYAQIKSAVLNKYAEPRIGNARYDELGKGENMEIKSLNAKFAEKVCAELEKAGVKHWGKADGDKTTVGVSKADAGKLETAIEAAKAASRTPDAQTQKNTPKR